jgi:cytochrome c biogenesis protein CcmG, thiol:disulfide interchange protein DsbE
VTARRSALRRRARWLAPVLLLALVAACGGSSGAVSSGSGGGMGGGRGGMGGAALGNLPACPQLVHAAPVDDGLPDLTLPCLGRGPAVNLADLRGKPLVLNVWAAWCGNCRREMPLFREAIDRAGHRVAFFGVHYKAPRGFGLQSAHDFGVPFPSVQDSDGDKVVEALHAYAPPVTLFVAADGTLRGREIGEIRSESELEGLVHRYLGVTL